MTASTDYNLKEYLVTLVNKWRSSSQKLFIYVDNCSNPRKTIVKQERERIRVHEKSKITKALEEIQYMFENSNLKEPIKTVINTKSVAEAEFKTLIQLTDNPFDSTTSSTIESIESNDDLTEVDILTPVSYEEDEEDRDFYMVTNGHDHLMIHNKVLSELKIKDLGDSSESYYFTGFNKDSSSIKTEDINLSSYIKLLFYKSGIKTACTYILNYLIDNSIIDKGEVVTCDERDAEVEIIRKIKTIQEEDEKSEDASIREHFIISEDQDIFIFGFEHLSYRAFITTISLNKKESLVLVPSHLGNNLTRIGIIVSKSDYFKGLDKIALSNTLLEDLVAKKTFEKLETQIFSLEMLLALVMFSTHHKPTKALPLSRDIAFIKNIIADIELYLSMDSSFYEKKKSFPKISFEEAARYCLDYFEK